MRRRRFLATLSAGGVVALAGCTFLYSSLRLVPVDDDASIADEYARSAGRFHDEAQALIAEAVAEGSAIEESTRPSHIARGRPIEYQGTFYQFDHEVVETRIEHRYVLRVDTDPSTPVAGATVAVEDLPHEDRTAVRNLLPPPESHEPEEGYDLREEHLYPTEAESVLVPEPDYDALTYEGTTYPIDVSHVQDVEFHTYRYTASAVAADASELATQLRDRYRFTVSGLSSEERALLETAIEEPYENDDGDPPPEFRSLVERFRDHEAIERDEDRGEWLLRYDGRDYWAYVEYYEGSLETETDDG